MVHRKNYQPQELSRAVRNELRSTGHWDEPRTVLGWVNETRELVLYDEDANRYVSLPSVIIKQIIHQFADG